ncbi:hypothetical protein TWF281_008812 [Arthrobotrys megalospora]
MLQGSLRISRSGTSGKRDVESIDSLEDTLSLRDTQAMEVLDKLNKRQASTCGCYEPRTELYPLKSLEPYMATPFGACTISASTSNLCPIDHVCACQATGVSMCVPTAAQTTTECGTPYPGPTTYPPTNFTWSLSAPLAEFAFPTEQCGGTLAPYAALSWNPIQTMCPQTQSCVCETASRFSRCIDTTAIADGAPTDCLTCRYEFNYDLPAPTGTAQIGGQCGGKCWTGPTNCPTSATCFTELSPTPGGYAQCGFSNPVRQLKVRQEGRHEVMDVPARVQAIATPIYF